MLRIMKSFTIPEGNSEVTSQQREIAIRVHARFWIAVATALTVITLGLASAASATMINLTEPLQGSGNKGFSFRPFYDDGATQAPFVMTARSSIDKNQPFNPNALGYPGTVYIEKGDMGAGVQNSSKGGSKGISGGGGDQNEELIFTYDNAVSLNSIFLGLNGIEFGSGLYDKDDPLIFLSLAGSGQFGVTIFESEISAAFTSSGSNRGVVDFGSFTSLLGTESIDAFKISETNDHIFVTGVSEGTHAPEPATMLLLGSGLGVLAGFRRKFRKG